MLNISAGECRQWDVIQGEGEWASGSLYRTVRCGDSGRFPLEDPELSDPAQDPPYFTTGKASVNISVSFALSDIVYQMISKKFTVLLSLIVFEGYETEIGT